MGRLVRFVLCFPTLARPFYVSSFAILESFVHFANFCFKTPVGIKLPHRKATFCALVPAGRKVYFLSQRDLEGAQDRFFEKCEILSKSNEEK